MKVSLHTHTIRCKHAFGNDEEYVKAAIAEGLNILGFADHAPMRYKGGFVSTYKMLPTEIDGYFSSHSSAFPSGDSILVRKDIR